MQSSSMAVAGDLPPTEPTLQAEEEDDLNREFQNPPSSPPSSPTARSPKASPSLSVEEKKMDEAEDLLWKMLSDSSDDDELGKFDPPKSFDKSYYKKVEKLIRGEETEELVWLAKNDGPPRRLLPYERPPAGPRRLNLMNDPLLSVVIATKKTQIALELIKQLPDDKLEAKNFNGDTALHVAAIVGDPKVANALLNKSLNLDTIANNKGEIPLHKAALYGQEEVFKLLVEKGKSSPALRTEEGNTALHCAIMGNAPGLALKIAKEWRHLAIYRNGNAVTPLQLLVTVPEAFRSQLVLGTLDNFLYNCIPLPEERPKSPRTCKRLGIRDIEDQDFYGENSQEIEEEDIEERSGRWIQMLLIILRPIQIFIFKLLIRVSPRITERSKQKVAHREALKLIACLAKYPSYFDLFLRGDRKDELDPASSQKVRRVHRGRKKGWRSEQRDHLSAVVDNRGGFTIGLGGTMAAKFLRLDGATRGSDAPAAKGILRSANRALKTMSSVRNWAEPPLIMGAEMGLHEFVKKILQVCPESASHLDSRGRNVLQAAIESGSREIVEFIHKMTTGDNPVLPSWLLSHTRSRRTILHLSAERIPPDIEDAVQLQDELRFFEMVKDMVPNELVYSRNKEEKTAQEVFSESHKEMLQSCKNQLMEMGKTCAGLVAAVVFASSFSIPGEKDEKTGNPVYMDRLPFKIFSHTYVIGLSCATTSLVLFLSLVIAPYKEQQFRWAIPTKYFLACLSFILALLALLLSFTCNIFLQIYGGQRTESDDLIPLILELTVFPAFCLILLFYMGTTFWPALRRIWT